MTSNADTIAHLFAQLGPDYPQIDAIAQDADADRWAIEFDDGTIVVAELDSSSQIVTLSSELGEPAEKHRMEVCEALLSHASLPETRGAMHPGLAEPGGAFIQQCDLPAAGLDAQGLGSQLCAFAAKARLWQQAIEQWGNASHRTELPFTLFCSNVLV